MSMINTLIFVAFCKTVGLNICPKFECDYCVEMNKAQDTLFANKQHRITVMFAHQVNAYFNFLLSIWF